MRRRDVKKGGERKVFGLTNVKRRLEWDKGIQNQKSQLECRGGRERRTIGCVTGRIGELPDGYDAEVIKK